MPIRLLGRSQRPLESRGGQPLAYVRVLGDVAVVIVVDERMVIDRVVKRERDHGQQQTRDGIASLQRRKQTQRLLCGCSFIYGRQQQNLTTKQMAAQKPFAGPPCSSVSAVVNRISLGAAESPKASTAK